MKASTVMNDKPKPGSRGYRYPDELISNVVARVTGGESVSAVSKDTGIGGSTIQRWLRKRRKPKGDPEPPNQLSDPESAGTDIQAPDSSVVEHRQITTMLALPSISDLQHGHDGLPDKAIDLIDETASALRIEAECSGTKTDAQLVLDDAMVARQLAKRIGRPAEDMQLVPAKTGSQA